MDREQLIEELFTTSELIMRQWKDRFWAIMAKEDLNMQQMHLLMQLRDAPLLGKELAERMMLTPSSITQHIEALVGKGYVSRRQDKKDRRNVYIELTAYGTDKIQRFRTLRIRMLTEMNASLTTKELQADLARQKKILASMQATDSQK